MHITHLTALSASSPNRSHHSGGAGDTAAPPQMPNFIVRPSSVDEPSYLAESQQGSTSVFSYINIFSEVTE